MYILWLNVLLSGSLALILNATTKDSIFKYYHVTADFGIQYNDPLYETSAPLIAIDPADGCSSIVNGADLDGKVVLVRRGGCNFFDKALIVESYGGVALVVGNNEGNDELLQMHRAQSDTDVEIPCVFISENNYGLVYNEVSRDPAGSVIATISAAEEYPFDGFWSTTSLTRIVTYMLIICPTLWAILSSFQCCLRFIAHRRLVRKQARVIPEVRFTSELLGEKRVDSTHITNESCPICLEKFEEMTKIKLLPCDHGFHKGCIEPWIADHQDSCPICRQTVLDKLEGEKRERSCCFCRPRRRSFNQRLLSSNSETEDEIIVVSLQVQDEDAESAQPNNRIGDLPAQSILFETLPIEEDLAELSDGVGHMEAVASGGIPVLQSSWDGEIRN